MTHTDTLIKAGHRSESSNKLKNTTHRKPTHASQLPGARVVDPFRSDPIRSVPFRSVLIESWLAFLSVPCKHILSATQESQHTTQAKLKFRLCVPLVYCMGNGMSEYRRRAHTEPLKGAQQVAVRVS